LSYTHTCLSTSDQTLENQNEEELNDLHGKIKALRSVRMLPNLAIPRKGGLMDQVTIDILDDSSRQNDQVRLIHRRHTVQLADKS
jgi:hypothetical protein